MGHLYHTCLQRHRGYCQREFGKNVISRVRGLLQRNCFVDIGEQLMIRTHCGCGSMYKM